MKTQHWPRSPGNVMQIVVGSGMSFFRSDKIDDDQLFILSKRRLDGGPPPCAIAKHDPDGMIIGGRLLFQPIYAAFHVDRRHHRSFQRSSSPGIQQARTRWRLGSRVVSSAVR